MNTAVTRVLQHWRSQASIQPRRGLRRQEIDAICAERGVVLPAGLIQLIEAADGFEAGGDQDERGFTFWPLAQMNRVDAFAGGRHAFVGAHSYLLFCDYLGWSWAYAVKVEGEPSEIGTVVMVGTRDGKPFRVANSFEEFLDAYLEDNELLYGGP